MDRCVYLLQRADQDPLPLSQVARDLVELGFQVGSDRVQGRDDDNGDEAGDQAVFDGCRAGIVFIEAIKDFYDSLS